MKSVFWGNYKGGVGKTTSTFQVAAHFAEHGKKVLLIDLDPQCSLSNICCKDLNYVDLDDFKVTETLNYLLELYIREIDSNNDLAIQLLTGTVRSMVKKYITQTVFTFSGSWANGNLAFIPGRMISNARMNELAQVMSENVYNIFLIKQFLDDIRALGDEDSSYKFDYVFFDCPPTTNMLTQSVFLSSDYYIIPTICDEVSTKGVPDYINEIEKIRDRYSVNNQIRGVLIEKVFPVKSQFIGVFETLYKARAGSPQNYRIIEFLDKNITNSTGVKSVLSLPQFVKHRYDPNNGTGPNGKPINPENIKTLNIFHSVNSIDHKDARASGESIPRDTANALPTGEYQDLAAAIMDMI